MTQQHAACFGCSASHPSGLGLDFLVLADGSVQGAWRPRSEFQSYDGIMHGGVIATLLDSAMVHALFARGIVAMTGELNVRFRRPVKTGTTVEVRAHLAEDRAPLFKLAAEVSQDGAVCARGTGRFMQTRAAGPSESSALVTAGAMERAPVPC